MLIYASEEYCEIMIIYDECGRNSEAAALCDSVSRKKTHEWKRSLRKEKKLNRAKKTGTFVPSHKGVFDRPRTQVIQSF